MAHLQLHDVITDEKPAVTPSEIVGRRLGEISVKRLITAFKIARVDPQLASFSVAPAESYIREVIVEDREEE